MSMKDHENKPVRYTIITQEDEETGDLLIPLPPPLLKEMGWQEGDDIQIEVDKAGRYIFHKVSK